MNKAIQVFWTDKVSASGFIVAASGILLQIYAGVASVAVPVGAIVLLTVAALIFLRVWRWSTTLGVVVATFILIGAFIAPGLTNRLSNPSQLGPFMGTVLQLLGLVSAIIFGIAATRAHANPTNKIIR